ncbi:hypothetical protein LY78DRAFT_730056, partial [Colletotrichum sublineola]
ASTGVTILKTSQHHPATYQCTLCHIEEINQDVCTAKSSPEAHKRTPLCLYDLWQCITRDNDWISHEEIHSGEKRFVCRDDLRVGGQWGCGQRFNRAGNLGKHFRSETGTIYTKPLLEEKFSHCQTVWELSRKGALERKAALE